MTNPQLLFNRFCQYSETFKGNTKATLEWLRASFRLYYSHSSVSDIAEITQSSIEDWIVQGKLNRKWGPKTIKLRLQAMSLFCDWCVKRKHMISNPCDNIPHPTLPKKIPKVLSEESASDLMEWAQNYPFPEEFERLRATAILGMFLFTGIRKSELVNLHLFDVDINSQRVLIRGGKGRKDRSVPFCTRLNEYLKPYVRARSKRDHCNPYFFVRLRGDDKMGDKAIQRLVGLIRNKSGIYFFPHMLRSTYATLMIQGGCDIYSLSKLLGHSDIKTTTIYLAASESHLRDKANQHPMNY